MSKDTHVLNAALQDLLLCPATGTPLLLSVDKQWLLSFDAQCAFPIHEGVPILLSSEARPLTEEELYQL